ncbi:MAG: helix-turn-helix domain-containing protein, partial [Planctomycetota bacterium]|nr:helix-turn-helix domain-containing protein [Planctomycetota bacterium]
MTKFFSLCAFVALLAIYFISYFQRVAVPGTIFDELQRRGLGLARLEQALIEEAVRRSGGNLTAAARSLGLTRAQLRYR